MEFLRDEDNNKLNSTVPHPLQSWEWGEFREGQGQKAVRIGYGDNKAVQILFRPVPKLPFTYGYVPKCEMPDAKMVAAVRDVAKRENAVFVKFEPEVEVGRWKNVKGKLQERKEVGEFNADSMKKLGLKEARRTVFDEFTFVLDLEQDDDAIMANMHSKTRYNIRLARKKGVTVEEMSNPEGVELFLKLNEATTKRQRFYLHNDQYFRDMWSVLGEAGIMRLLVGRRGGRSGGGDRAGGDSNDRSNGQPLCVWILFHWNDVLYYPYGASSDEHRNLMASNLVAWEAVQLGKRLDCKTLDFWGSLGPEPDTGHPWFGFHRFKQGYGGDLVELIGSWDLVLNPLMYRVLLLADGLRWGVMRVVKRLRGVV